MFKFEWIWRKITPSEYFFEKANIFKSEFKKIQWKQNNKCEFPEYSIDFFMHLVWPKTKQCTCIFIFVSFCIHIEFRRKICSLHLFFSLYFRFILPFRINICVYIFSVCILSKRNTNNKHKFSVKFRDHVEFVFLEICLTHRGTLLIATRSFRLEKKMFRVRLTHSHCIAMLAACAVALFSSIQYLFIFMKKCRLFSKITNCIGPFCHIAFKYNFYATRRFWMCAFWRNSVVLQIQSNHTITVCRCLLNIYDAISADVSSAHHKDFVEGENQHILVSFHQFTYMETIHPRLKYFDEIKFKYTKIFQK